MTPRTEAISDRAAQIASITEAVSIIFTGSSPVDVAKREEISLYLLDVATRIAEEIAAETQEVY
jgi:hypothetical protein